MYSSMKKIGISGGTFDPIHHGHLIIAENIREKFKLDKVLFIPTGIPPHKIQSNVTSPEHRFNMVTHAINSNPYFDVSRIEIERKGLTYTIDTLIQLKEIYNNSQLYFITGADVVKDIVTWKRFEEVLELCEFIAALRPGYKKEDFVKDIEFLKSKYLAKIHIAEVPLIGISSTIVRDRVRDKQSIKYLVPESVEGYIEKNNLYIDLKIEVKQNDSN